LERRRVGPSHHVGLLDAGEPLDGRPVEAHPLDQRGLQLLRGDGDRLEEPEDVGEPQPDELDPPLLDGAQDVLGLVGHGEGSLRPAEGPLGYVGVNLHDPRSMRMASKESPTVTHSPPSPDAGWTYVPKGRLASSATRKAAAVIEMESPTGCAVSRSSRW